MNRKRATRRGVARGLVAAVALCVPLAPAWPGAAGAPGVQPVHPRIIVNNVAVWPDPAGDASLRRTDVHSPGDSFTYGGVAPDIVALRLSGWRLKISAADAYDGVVVPGSGADLLRLDVEMAGLVNPPGTLGLGGRLFRPFQFGPSPVYGFIELDIDSDVNTGGDFEPAAQALFLANVARFAALPRGAHAQRAARSAEDYDGAFNAGRQFERSGAEFVLALCGCDDVALVSGDADGDGAFGWGETWIVRGRLFQRSGGFELASGAFNGSEPGWYDPPVDVRFSHSAAGDRTTITLVYPLTMAGAASLRNEPEQPPDDNVGNHTSVEEAMLDVMNYTAANTPPTAVAMLVGAWANLDALPSFNPLAWDATAILAAPYQAPQTALFVYTDAAFGLEAGDVNGDGLTTMADRSLVNQTIAQMDGGPRDDDGVVNGSVAIGQFSHNFSLFDIDYNGVIDSDDAGQIAVVPNGPDINGDGVVNASDLALLLGSWGALAGAADLNGDEIVNASDLALLLGSWGPAPTRVVDGAQPTLPTR